MWKCSRCGNDNKDEYRFCLNCGEPRPEPGDAPAEKSEAPKPKKTKAAVKKDRRDRVLTGLLLILALLLTVVIAAVIVNYQRLRDSVPSASYTQRGDAPRSGSAKAEGSEDSGGTSIFVFGTESAAPVTFAPATPKPAAAPSAAPTAAPTEKPLSDSEYLLPDSDRRYLTEADLKDLSWRECCLARNEIFARHGRLFATQEIADYFSAKSWYRGTIPAAGFSETVLNEYESANVNFIRQYENTHWGGSYY